MLNKSDVEAILEDITIGAIGSKGWIFLGEMGNGYYLQHQYYGTDSVAGGDRLCKGRKWYISPHSCKSEIVLTALKAVITNAEHEARESFKYKGKAIFGPHMNVDKLLEFCDTEEHTEGRNDGPQ